MRRPRGPFLAWPGWALPARALLLALPVTLWWVLVYHGTNRLTGLRTYRVPVHLDAELAIPFVPPFIIAYLSLNFVFLPAPFILRSRHELEALALSVAAAIAVAGVSFLLFPAELAYSPCDPGAWSASFALARELALPNYNLVPSLHVAMSCICLAAYATHCGPAGKALLAAWASVIALSTLLTHQHHLLDVATGLALAVICKRFIYDRWLALPPDTRKLPASPSDGQGPLA
jgi:membrane-associated phospholipid phosphatase